MDPAARLAEAVKQRREDLGLSQDDVAYAAKAKGRELSANTVRNVEAAKTASPRPPTLAALDAGLDWPEGHARSVLEGRPEPQQVQGLAERLTGLEAEHLERLVTIAVPAQKLTDAEALAVVLRCLSLEQYAMVARAVQADDRFVAL